MVGEVVNSRFVLLSKFDASRQESASKTATSHIRNTLYVIYIKKKNENRTCSYMTKNLLLKKETSA